MENYLQSVAPAKLAFNLIQPVNGAIESLSPFVFLHAFGDSKEFWMDIPEKISNETGRKSYVIDLREHGDTEWSNYFSLNAAINDVIHFMDLQNISKAILVGHSIGGTVVSRVALLMPTRVEILFMEDSRINNYSNSLVEKTIDTLKTLEEAVRNVPKELNLAEATRFVVDYLYSKMSIESQKKCTSKERLYKLKYPIKREADGSYCIKHNIKAIIFAGQNKELEIDEPEGTFTNPTYVFYGNFSPFKIKEHEAKIRDHFPFARMILFSGATHNVHLEFPEKFIKNVLKYSKKHFQG